jgi:hypothetical protein
VWASEIAKAFVWLVGVLAILVAMAMLAPESRGDTLGVSGVAYILDTQSVLPLAQGVDTQLASNLLRAQQQTWGNEWLDGSLTLSIESVLRAITFYVWDGGPTEITKDNAPVVWLQSHIAIDPSLSVGFDTVAIDFGAVEVVSTPEPAACLSLIVGLTVLVLWRQWPTMARRKVARLRAHRLKV